MATNIDNSVQYVSSSKRTSAIMIDVFIIAILRIFTAQILGMLWVNNALEKLVKDFNEHFGTEIIKNNPEHLEFIVNHPSFVQILILYFIILMVGLLYHSLLNASAWQATIGKRLMNARIVQDDYKKISGLTAVSHYILSVLPILYMIYIFGLMINNHLTLFHAITYSEINIFLGFLAILWIQIHSFTKRKTTVYDLVCKVVYIEGRTSAKYPWSKV
jgi:uncharacterized RDD family membrane protein YckC